MTTIKDVAKAAGVSPATVSYVLNKKKRLSPEVEERVREAIQRLNYHPHMSARNLRRDATFVLGYELPLPETGDVSVFMQRFVYGLAVEAAKVGYSLAVFATLKGMTDIDHYQQMIRANHVDGFIVANTNWYDQRIEYLLENDFPFVSFGRTQTDKQYAYVDIDGFNGLCQVVEHLVQQNHQRIAFIGWPPNSFSGDDRYAGYCQTLVASGITPQPADTTQRVHNTIEGGYTAAANLMALATPPTAIACVSDVIAIGAIRYLQQHGYRVGQDIAVTGFDDNPLNEFITPSLTTIAQPVELVEQEVIRILTAQLEGRAIEDDQVIIKPRLIIRESTAFSLNA